VKDGDSIVGGGEVREFDCHTLSTPNRVVNVQDFAGLQIIAGEINGGEIS
jgi:hypothetical protein